MFNFINWFYTTYFYTPARNAPNDGVDIKKFIEKNEIKTITSDDLSSAISNLKKVDTNNDKPLTYTSPLLKEMDEVFKIGYKNYFKNKKQTVFFESIST